MSAPEHNTNLQHYIKRRRQRRIAAMLAIVALAAVVVAGFVTSRVFDLSVLPEEAAATWQRSEGRLLTMGSRILLFSERGAITIRADGFASQTLVIDKNSERQQIQARLEPLPGLVLISVLSSGAFNLFVNETAQGGNAQTEVALQQGVHSVRIDGIGIKPIEAEIEVRGYGETQHFEFKTEPSNSVFAIATEPSDARIFLNGKAIGRGSYEGPVNLGDHTITIERKGYRSRQLHFSAEPDKRIDLGLVQLTPAPAELSIASIPSAAAVLVNGRYVGTTPLTQALAPSRPHHLVIRKNGYETLETRIELAPGERLARNFQLGSTTYTAKVSADIKARVALNGVAQGFTPAKVTVRTGDRVAVSRDGYQTQSIVVDPVGGEQRTYDFTMMRPNEYAFHQAPSEERVANGIVLRKFPPASLRIPSIERGGATDEIQLTRPFYLGVYEITYQAFLPFKNRPIPRGLGPLHPATNLTWSEAARFCNWLSEQHGLAAVYEFDEAGELRQITTRSLGYRLPTEAEWEAAAGYDFSAGSVVGPYPWGQNRAIPRAFGNFAGREAKNAGQDKVLFDYVDNHAGIAPSGSYAANFNGIFDLAGNVAEWVTDYHAPRPAVAGTTLVDPLGPPTGVDHVVKGSSFRSHEPAALAIEHRTLVAGRSDAVGFRVARWIY